MQLTKAVLQARLNCDLDLRALANALVDVRYDPTQFCGLIWQHRNIGEKCVLFATARLNVTGNAVQYNRACGDLDAIAVCFNEKDVT